MEIAEVIKISHRIANLCEHYKKLQDFLVETFKTTPYQEAGWNFIKTLTFHDKLEFLEQNPFIIGQKLYDLIDGKITNFIYEKMNEIIKELKQMPEWAKNKLKELI